MKRLITIYAALIVLFLCGNLFAQTTTDELTLDRRDGGKYLTYASLTLDSAETTWSNDFLISQNDGFSYTTFPWQVGYDLAAADSVNISVYWYGAYIDGADNDNWVIIDTLFTVTSSAALSGAETTADLNNKKPPFNKIKVVNNTGSKANTLELGVSQPVSDN